MAVIDLDSLTLKSYSSTRTKPVKLYPAVTDYNIKFGASLLSVNTQIGCLIGPEVVVQAEISLSNALSQRSLVTSTSIACTGDVISNPKTFVDVDISQLKIDWIPGENYRFEIGEDFVREIGEASPKASELANISYTANGLLSPAVSNPAPGNNNVTNNTFIEITFDRRFNPAYTDVSSVIELYKAPSTLIQSYSISGGTIEVTNNQTIRLETEGLLEANSTYYLLSSQTIFRDFDYIPFELVSDTDFRFTTDESGQLFPDFISLQFVSAAINANNNRLRPSAVTSISSLSNIDSVNEEYYKGIVNEEYPSIFNQSANESFIWGPTLNQEMVSTAEIDINYRAGLNNQVLEASANLVDDGKRLRTTNSDALGRSYLNARLNLRNKYFNNYITRGVSNGRTLFSGDGFTLLYTQETDDFTSLNWPTTQLSQPGQTINYDYYNIDFSGPLYFVITGTKGDFTDPATSSYYNVHQFDVNGNYISYNERLLPGPGSTQLKICGIGENKLVIAYRDEFGVPDPTDSTCLVIDPVTNNVLNNFSVPTGGFDFDGDLKVIDNTLYIGVGYNTPVDRSNRVYQYDLATNGILRSYVNPDNQGSGFGYSIDAFGNRLVISSIDLTPNVPNPRGRVWVYNRTSLTPLFELVNPAVGPDDDAFGEVVQVSEKYIVVTARTSLQQNEVARGSVLIYDSQTGQLLDEIRNQTMQAGLDTVGAAIFSAYHENEYLYYNINNVSADVRGTVNRPVLYNEEEIWYNLINNVHLTSKATTTGGVGNTTLPAIASITENSSVITPPYESLQFNILSETPESPGAFGLYFDEDNSLLAATGLSTSDINVYDLESQTPDIPITQITNTFPYNNIKISGTRIVVSEANEDVKVYDAITGALLHTITDPITGQFTNFGNKIDLVGDTLLVNAPSFGDGFIWVYDLASGTPTTPLYDIFKPASISGGSFGFGFALNENNILGVIYFNDLVLYDLNSATPDVAVSISPVITGVVNANMPDVIINGNRISYHHAGIVDRVRVVNITDLLNPVEELVVESFTNSSSFGDAFAMTGDLLVVSDTQFNSFTGIIYYYDLSSGTPTVPYSSRTPGAGIDGFGFKLAIEGSRLYVYSSLSDRILSVYQ